MSRSVFQCDRWLVVGLVLGLTGCMPAPEQVIQRPPDVGVGYQVVVPETAPRYGLGPGEVAQMPELQKDVAPKFPPELVSRGGDAVRILAQLVINESGRVDRVIFHPLAVQDNLEPFMVSVREAVSSWEFSPLVIIRTVRGKTGEIKSERAALPVSLWYQFRFEVKNGKPTTAVKGHHST